MTGFSAQKSLEGDGRGRETSGEAAAVPQARTLVAGRGRHGRGGLARSWVPSDDDTCGCQTKTGLKAAPGFQLKYVKDGVRRNEPCSLWEEQTGGRWGQLDCQSDVPERRLSGPLGPRDPALELAAWPSSAPPPPPGSGDTKLGVASIRPAGHRRTNPMRAPPLVHRGAAGSAPSHSHCTYKTFLLQPTAGPARSRRVLPLCVGAWPTRNAK